MVAAVAVFVNIEVLRPAEVGNAPAALRQQVPHRLVPALEVVEHHRTHIVAGQNAVEKHQWHAALAHLLEVLEIVRGAGQRHQNAVDPRVNQRVDIFEFVLVVFIRLAQHHVEARLAGHGLHALQHLRKKVVVDVGHNHAQRVAVAFAQGGGQVVGLVVELLGQGLHPVAGGLADARMPAQGPRNR